jgi:hypothetical protein
MTYPTAVVIAAGLIAGAVVLAGRADSQSPAAAKFVGVGVSENGTVAWRLDTGTGELSQCTVSNQRIVCLKP